jgi:hypothetical protein
MSIKSLVAGAVALAIACVPTLASAQEVGGSYYDPYGEAPYVQPQPQYTAVRVVPPAYGSVYLYEGRRLVGRFDGPGAMWLPTGRYYRVVAVRGDQMIWNGGAATTGAPLDLRWRAPRPWYPHPSYSYPSYPSYPYARDPYGSPYAPPRVLTPPIERGRVRTPF